MALQAFSIHAHFYQPPREDPQTGAIPIETSAAPYPNWNERIHAECYRPNADLRNFEHISFNIGPTLFGWMQAHDPHTCSRIIEQDQTNLQRFSVGNAMAQAYNHAILPLCSTHDKATQVYWGAAEFERRFGRKPQGMWLPETAVDLESLEILVRQGITYTILAPWQADAAGEIDPSEPYRVLLPGGRQITVFFYQSELSGRVSFDPQVTLDADQFAGELLPAYFNPEKTRRGEPQILVIASDGELYGHHQRQRDRFLARLVDGSGRQAGLTPTFPALWLQEHPARQIVQVVERTSWSCHHGVTRWMGDCACTGSDSSWKAQLRYAFERLAGELDHLYLQETRGVVHDPWLLRDHYIHVLLGDIPLDHLLFMHTGRALPSGQAHRLGLLLEAQRERQRMYTSCGWFFEDFDRIEPRNNVCYAAQVVRLTHQACGVDLSPGLREDLKRVVCPRTHLNASIVLERCLEPHDGSQIQSVN